MSIIEAKDGLLWRNGEIIPLPEADAVAAAHGYVCAEQMVRALDATRSCACRITNIDGVCVECGQEVTE